VYKVRPSTLVERYCIHTTLQIKNRGCCCVWRAVWWGVCGEWVAGRGRRGGGCYRRRAVVVGELMSLACCCRRRAAVIGWYVVVTTATTSHHPLHLRSSLNKDGPGGKQLVRRYTIASYGLKLGMATDHGRACRLAGIGDLYGRGIVARLDDRDLSLTTCRDSWHACLRDWGCGLGGRIEGRGGDWRVGDLGRWGDTGPWCLVWEMGWLEKGGKGGREGIKPS
jgi:hypothetical protein